MGGYRYWEAMNMTVTKAEAKAEIEKYETEGFEQFIEEFGDHAEYEGADVLSFIEV